MIEIDNIVCIYGIKNLVNNKFYVGETKNYKKRKSSHLSSLRSNKHYNDYLQKSFNKYGEENFEFFIIELLDNDITLEEIYEKEIYYIKEYDSFNNGYNLTTGGGGSKCREMSEEEKLARSIKYSGEGNPFYGKTHTEETIAYLRELSKGNVGEKNGFYGKTHSESFKEDRRKLYDEKIKNGWVDPKKGIKKPKESVELMKANMPHRKAINVDGVDYPSISECSRLLNIPVRTVGTRLKNDKFPNYKYIYE